MAENDVDNELLDYEDDEVENAGAGDGVDVPSKKDVKGSYVSIHSSGFRDFLLKPELLRAIVDCGFEHPSEGAPGLWVSHQAGGWCRQPRCQGSCLTLAGRLGALGAGVPALHVQVGGGDVSGGAWTPGFLHTWGVGSVSWDTWVLFLALRSRFWWVRAGTS